MTETGHGGGTKFAECVQVHLTIKGKGKCSTVEKKRMIQPRYQDWGGGEFSVWEKKVWLKGEGVGGEGLSCPDAVRLREVRRDRLAVLMLALQA